MNSIEPINKISKEVNEILREIRNEEQNEDALIGYEIQQYGNCELSSNSFYRTIGVGAGIHTRKGEDSFGYRM